MLKTKLNNIFSISVAAFTFFSLTSPSSFALAPKRIQSIFLNRGEAYKINVVPGLATVIKLPCFGADAISGDESQVTVRFSPTTKKELQINMKSTFSRATNLIVRCEGQSTHLVFDLVPSRSVHQDILEVRQAFGNAAFEGEQAEIKSIKPESDKVQKIVISTPVLLDSNKLTEPISKGK